jgi:hypothetical protein
MTMETAALAPEPSASECVVKKAAAPEPSWFQSGVAACCCMEIQLRDNIYEPMFRTEPFSPPSLIQWLCLWNCCQGERKANGLMDIPELKGLTGVMMQNSDNSVAGTMLTLRFSKWDAERRMLDANEFGGSRLCTGQTNHESWTTVPTCECGIATTCARLSNFTYRFYFSEDYKQAEIYPAINPCICIPCLPPWCVVPSWVQRCDMVQKGDSIDGTWWDRRAGDFCDRSGEMKSSYDLQEVFTPEGTPGRFHDQIVKAPEMFMMSV